MKEYRIKKNFAKAGNIGPFPVRNVVEGIILAGILFVLIFKCSIALSIKLMLLVISVVPVLVLCLYGISGNSLVEIMVRYLKFHLFFQREYSHPTMKEFSQRERRILKVKNKQLKKHIAQIENGPIEGREMVE